MQNAKPKIRILLTDGWTRKSLSAVRSLGFEGYNISLATHKLISPALYSKFTHRGYIFPNPKTEKEKYKAMLLLLLEKEKFDVLIPFEEETIEVLLENYEKFNALTKFSLPSIESYSIASDKWKTLQTAKQLNIPTPETFLLERIQDTAEILNNEKLFPVIAKPVKSSGSRGLSAINNKKEGLKILETTLKRFGSVLLQEKIPQEGQGVGVGILAENGKVKAVFSYRRLREFPVKGGPSTLRESTHDEELIKDAVKLMETLKWNGVAMVEFKTDIRTGQKKLMEINPRFWGSMDLAFVSGVNFPALLTKMILGKEIQQPVYKTGIRCRWLLPGDIAHFIANPERWKLQPSFFNFFSPELYYDDFKPYDIKGNIAVIFCTLLSIFDWETWKKGIFRN